MYILKHFPEDFIVVEKPLIRFEGQDGYAIFEMGKRNYTTLDAIKRIALQAKISPKDLGFAGNKDRKAITTQYISVFRGSQALQDLSLADINLAFRGYSKKKIALGDLEGNAFSITIRSLGNEEVEKIRDFEKKNNESPKLIPNYFGPQRFSSANHAIGCALVKKDYAKAIELICKNDDEHGPGVREFIEANSRNFIGAIRLVPQTTLRMYVHAYQSLLFNKMLFGIAKNPNEISPHKEENPDEFILPLIGFGTEAENYGPLIGKLIGKTLHDEKITARDFINRQMPELSSEGGSRQSFYSAQNFRIIEEGGDECFSGKIKVKIEFFLKKSCYATVLVSHILEGIADFTGNMV